MPCALPLALRQQKSGNLLRELEGEGELVPSRLQDSDLAIVCGQNRFKMIVSVLWNFLSEQIGGGDIEQKSSRTAQGYFCPG